MSQAGEVVEGNEEKPPENETKEKNTKLSDMKGEVQEEIKQLEKHLSDMDKMKSESISKIESKKIELRRLSQISNVREEHAKVIEQLKSTKTEITERKLSIAFMDQTIASLDEQIGVIQAEHDRIAGEIELKRGRLLDKIKFYEELNHQIEKLVDLLKNEELLFKSKLEDLMKQKEGLMNNTDLSPEFLEQALKDLDLAIERLQQEHEAVKNQLKIKLSVGMDETIRDQLIAEIDAKLEIKVVPEEEIQIFDQESIAPQSAAVTEESSRYKATATGTAATEGPRIMTDAERFILTRRGLIITPSDRIIMKDENIITIEEAELLGLLLDDFEEPGEDGMGKEVLKKKIDYEELEITQDAEKSISDEEIPEKAFYGSFTSHISTLPTESSSESIISNADVHYLKNTFGKVLSLGLAEITQVQPFDPIHYLAHWLFKYRFNQEIEIVKQRELEELLNERKRLEELKLHEAIEAEAKQAVWDAWLKAEDIIMTRDMISQYTGEEEEMMEQELVNI